MSALKQTAQEHAYLVARGVRPLALVGHCPARPAALRRVRRALEDAACEGAQVFVHDRGDGFADYGYAAAPWVCDLYTWAVTSAEADETMPIAHRHRIVGLLLGYSVPAISDFESREPINTFWSAV